MRPGDVNADARFWKKELSVLFEPEARELGAENDLRMFTRFLPLHQLEVGRNKLVSRR